MITCDEGGNIIVKIDGDAYNLSNSEQYADFLLWATSPDEKVAIGDDSFKIADDVSEEHRKKVSRYAEFLIDYAHKRQAKLSEMAKVLTAEQREKDIQKFIDRLQSADA
jgi:hypothetical protein